MRMMTPLSSAFGAERRMIEGCDQSYKLHLGLNGCQPYQDICKEQPLSGDPSGTDFLGVGGVSCLLKLFVKNDSHQKK